MWDAAGDVRHQLRFAGARGVAFSSQGTLAVSSMAGPVRLYEAATGTVLRSFTGHRHGTRALGFSPDGNRLLTGGGTGTLRLWWAGPAHGTDDR